jgi:hypothetical protein
MTASSRSIPAERRSGLPCLARCDRSNSFWSGMELVIALNQASCGSHLSLASIAREQGLPFNVARGLFCN